MNIDMGPGLSTINGDTDRIPPLKPILKVVVWFITDEESPGGITGRILDVEGFQSSKESSFIVVVYKNSPVYTPSI